MYAGEIIVLLCEGRHVSVVHVAGMECVCGRDNGVCACVFVHVHKWAGM